MERSTDTFDVVLIGSWFAGLAAAIEARETGASVVVLEKMKAPRGELSCQRWGYRRGRHSAPEKVRV